MATKILTSPNAAPVADVRTLSTLESDGSRRWLTPRLARGNLWNARRLVAYALIAIYALVPYIRMNGEPMVLIDVIHRRFHLFGVTFLPTDTTLLALLVLIVGLTVFFATAVLGRVWCGWACPQTVYMEFVFRPIERLFTGTVSRGGKPKNVAAWRVAAMYVAFLLISIHLANMLLAYFIGAEQVHRYIWSSTPLQHPGAFAVVALASAWIMWDFAYWREQMCIIGCPYGRMQSVLLDRNSLIVSYDYRRGEPRGKTSRRVSLKTLDDAPAATTGDCVDCTMCVQVCPTGIDIRDGLQLECVNCTQCIDACNTVMDKVGRPRGLIGFSSQSVRDGERARWLRPRVVVYPLLIAILLSLFSFLLFTRPGFDLTVMRNAGRPFNVLPDGRIENTMRIKLVNRERLPRTYSIDIVDAAGATVSSDIQPHLSPLESGTAIVRVSLPAEQFVSDHVDVQMRIRTDAGETVDRFVRLLGPAGANRSESQP
jgi:cytochrome c oxidase accessory protein FixG